LHPPSKPSPHNTNAASYAQKRPPSAISPYSIATFGEVVADIYIFIAEFNKVIADIYKIVAIVYYCIANYLTMLSDMFKGDADINYTFADICLSVANINNVTC
jgi:hypothetical protein